VIAFSLASTAARWRASGLTGKVQPYNAGSTDVSRMSTTCPTHPYHVRHARAFTCRPLEHCSRRTWTRRAWRAIIIDPLLGEGGFYAAPLNFCVGCAALLQPRIGLIADEIA